MAITRREYQELPDEGRPLNVDPNQLCVCGRLDEEHQLGDDGRVLCPDFDEADRGW